MGSSCGVRKFSCLAIVLLSAFSVCGANGPTVALSVVIPSRARDPAFELGSRKLISVRSSAYEEVPHFVRDDTLGVLDTA